MVRRAAAAARSIPGRPSGRGCARGSQPRCRSSGSPPATGSAAACRPPRRGRDPMPSLPPAAPMASPLQQMMSRLQLPAAGDRYLGAASPCCRSCCWCLPWRAWWRWAGRRPSAAAPARRGGAAPPPPMTSANWATSSAAAKYDVDHKRVAVGRINNGAARQQRS